MVLNVFLEDYVKHIYIFICTALHDEIFAWIFFVNVNKIFLLDEHKLKIKKNIAENYNYVALFRFNLTYL